LRRMRGLRKARKKAVKAAHHAVLMAEKAARNARRIARQEKRELNLRKHGTEKAGWLAGWHAATPLTEPELKALSFARRYVEAYVHGAAEKWRYQELMATQQTPAVPQPQSIKL